MAFGIENWSFIWLNNQQSLSSKTTLSNYQCGIQASLGEMEHKIMNDFLFFFNNTRIPRHTYG